MRSIKLSQPYITEHAIDSVIKVLESGWLTQGAKVAEFENAFKQYVHAQYAVAVNSATSGLHIALLGLGIGPGDEVIVPSFTWVATANAVELCGATPIFADIDTSTFNANVDAISAKITRRTKAIIIVHLFGKPVDVELVRSQISAEVAIIEDAACAAGSIINGKHCGTLGDVGVYSFHPRKSLTTGEGGMVVTNNSELYKSLLMLRNHGQDTSSKDDTISAMFDCPVVGLNYRMTDMQAALGIHQLSTLDTFIEYRNTLAKRYEQKLRSLANIRLPKQHEFERHSWQSYVVAVNQIPDRDHLMHGLYQFGIETRPGTHAVHMLKYYKDRYKYVADDLPNTYQARQNAIALPLHNHLTEDDIDYISTKIIEVMDVI